ncbi:MAG: peptidylprolyl isomerase [Salibacteraceae bacterium]
MKHLSHFLLFTLVSLIGLNAIAQGDKQVIDKVIAVVGDNVILKSDLENQYISFLGSGGEVTANTRCEILEELLFQNLLLNQSKLDSLVVSEGEIQNEIDRRLRYFVSLLGSEERLEEEYNKSIVEIREEFHDLVEDQLLIQRMQGKITESVEITPAEVKTFFNDIPKDSLPLIGAEAEIAQIVKEPPVSDEEKKRVKYELEELRQRVLKGENFGTLAYLYSEDPGSARQNGELGFLSRTQLVPEFSAVAFNLAPGEVSDIVETEYGFHIIQGIAKRGETINVRHILKIPKVSNADLTKAKRALEKIAGSLVQYDTLTFELAAGLYSDDKETKNSRGMLVNPGDGTTRFPLEQIGQADPSLFFVVDKLEVGQTSDPVVMQKPDGSRAYRLVKLISVTEPHRANLAQDYQRIHDMALAQKREKAITDWINQKIGNAYIRIDDDYAQCSFQNSWVMTQ